MREKHKAPAFFCASEIVDASCHGLPRSLPENLNSVSLVRLLYETDRVMKISTQTVPPGFQVLGPTVTTEGLIAFIESSRSHVSIKYKKGFFAHTQLSQHGSPTRLVTHKVNDESRRVRSRRTLTHSHADRVSFAPPFSQVVPNPRAEDRRRKASADHVMLPAPKLGRPASVNSLAAPPRACNVASRRRANQAVAAHVDAPPSGTPSFSFHLSMRVGLDLGRRFIPVRVATW